MPDVHAEYPKGPPLSIEAKSRYFGTTLKAKPYVRPDGSLRIHLTSGDKVFLSFTRTEIRDFAGGLLQMAAGKDEPVPLDDDPGPELWERVRRLL
jgi:hypothetical protein